jgi:molecular chaperone DnaK (HSP70)
MTRTRRTPVLGIDLGTIKSVAAIHEEGHIEPTIIKPHPELTDYTDPWLPSLVCLTDDEPLVGEPARRYSRNPHARDRSLLVRCVKLKMEYPTTSYSCAGRSYSPAEISSLILKHLREKAARQLDRPLSDFQEAVITVPAYFGHTEREETRKAGRLAGFERVQLLDEPIAAAMGLRVHEQLSGEQLILVVDLGGGTLDVTLLLAGTGARDEGMYELSRDGDSRLGGIEWDTKIALYALANSGHARWEERLSDPKLRFDDPSNILLFEPCERAKRAFCVERPRDSLDFEYVDFTDMRAYQVSLTHERFLKITEDLRERCVLVCERLLREVPPSELAKVRPGNFLHRIWPRRIRPLGWEDIQHIYMVGGGSRVTSVQKEIWSHWRRDGSVPQLSDRPELQIVFGAAYYAAQIDKYRERPIHSRCPHSIGIWWDRQTATSRFGNAASSDGGGNATEREFHPIIYKNERTPLSRCIESDVVGEGSIFRAELVEQRPSPLQPGAIDGHPASAQNNSRHIELGTLEIRDIPPPRHKRDHLVTLELCYESDGEMNFHGNYRGKHRKIQLKRSGPQSAGSSGTEPDNMGSP